MNDIKYYRHPIHKFDFTALEGKDKWTAYHLCGRMRSSIRVAEAVAWELSRWN